MKHFILFLVYCWIACSLALLLFTLNYFFCDDESCQFNAVEIQLVRSMSVLCLATLLFTSSMIMNVVFGIMTGVGTIDRLKKKLHGTWELATEEPIPLKDIFGKQNFFCWILPIDPVFDDYEQVMGYIIEPQEKQQRQSRRTIQFADRFVHPTSSVASHSAYAQHRPLAPMIQKANTVFSQSTKDSSAMTSVTGDEYQYTTMAEF